MGFLDKIDNVSGSNVIKKVEVDIDWDLSDLYRIICRLTYSSYCLLNSD